VTRNCQSCGVELQEGQDWCLQCGTAAPGSLQSSGPGWRSATVVLGVTTALVLGAAAAAYAALSQPAPAKPAPKVVTIAQAPPVTTPSTPTVATTPSTPSSLGTPTTIKPLPSSTKPPKIPLTAPTPKATAPAPTTGTGNANGEPKETGSTKTSPETETGSTKAEEPTPILLDTNAASTYNPYNYPATSFGDPSQAIDGETSTGWTAQVEPAAAPKMAVGLAIDLKAAQRIGVIALVTSTPGMIVQVYGSNATALPESITDPAWTTLTKSVKAKKRRTHLKLKDATKAFRFIALWISKAPASAVGTPTAPGHVSINELELFVPTGK